MSDEMSQLIVKLSVVYKHSQWRGKIELILDGDVQTLNMPLTHDTRHEAEEVTKQWADTCMKAAGMPIEDAVDLSHLFKTEIH